MTSGVRVVLALFGAVAAVAVVVVVAFLVTQEQAVRCVEGEAQDNAVRADGTVLPRVETFKEIAEGEAFVCRRIPHPRNTGDFDLGEVRVARERNLGDTIEGEGGVDIEVDYVAPGGRVLTFTAAFPPAPGPSGGQTVRVGSETGVLVADEGITSVYWSKAGWDFSGGTRLDDGFTTDNLLRVLESVR